MLTQIADPDIRAVSVQVPFLATLNFATSWEEGSQQRGRGSAGQWVQAHARDALVRIFCWAEERYAGVQGCVAAVVADGGPEDAAVDGEDHAPLFVDQRGLGETPLNGSRCP